MIPASDTAELMVAVMSRLLASADVLQLGLGSPLNQVAALLAHALGEGCGPAVEDPAGLTLSRAGRRASLSRGERASQEGAVRHFEAPEWIAQMMPRLAGRMAQFLRPLQIDPKGRINTLQVKDSQGRMRRFAGLAGLTELADIARPFFVYLPRQDQRCFVDEVDFTVCDPLASNTDPDARIIVVSNLAVFEITRAGARALSRHPGVSKAELREATPAAVTIDDEIEVTRSPDGVTLRLLRQVVDPLGVRNIEFLSGAERRERLLQLCADEATASFSTP